MSESANPSETCPFCDEEVGLLPSHLQYCDGKSPDPMTGDDAPSDPPLERSPYDIDTDVLAEYLRDRLDAGMRLLTTAARLGRQLDATGNGVANALRTLRDRESVFHIEYSAAPVGNIPGTWIIEREED